MTFLVLTGLTPFEPTHQVVVRLLLINVGFGLALVALVGFEIFGLSGRAGAARPAPRCTCGSSACSRLSPPCRRFFVAVIAFITLDRGLDNWFSTRVRGIVETSLIVANAYVQEQGRLIQGEALAMAADLNRAQPLYVTDPAALHAIS